MQLQRHPQHVWNCQIDALRQADASFSLGRQSKGVHEFQRLYLASSLVGSQGLSDLQKEQERLLGQDAILSAVV